MFAQIGKSRFKIASISAFQDEGYSPNTQKWYIGIRFGNRERKFAFGTEKEKDDYLDYLDAVLKVCK